VVEGDQRLRDSERRAIVLESVWFTPDQPAVLQDVQRMRKVTRFAPEVGGDASPGVAAFGDGGENRVVKADVPQVRLVGQQVARRARPTGLARPAGYGVHA
jgi:hypothetical protein